MKAASPHAERDVTMNTSNLHPDDEMALWLCPAVDNSQDSASQYSMDPRLEDHYCSEFFGQLPNVQSLRDDFTAGICAPGWPNRNLPPANYGGSKTASADAAMALGAGRAAGLLPQVGVEAFTKVRTTYGKWSTNSQTNTGNTISGASPTSFSTGAASTSLSPGAMAVPSLSSPVLSPKSQPMPARTGPMNFPHFSLPAVQMKANLHSIGMSHLSARSKTTFGGSRPFNANASSGSSIAESTITGLPSGISGKETTVEGSEGGQQQSLGMESRWPSSVQISLSSKEGDTAVNSSADYLDSDSMPAADLENQRLNPASVTDDKCTSQCAELQEPQEQTLTSSSGGSGISADRWKGVTSRGKKRSGEADESECQSDDADEEVVEPKKSQRGSTSKRTRAAEVHNLSERRRRDRINEKMKALQELIPNSNKADKASMLDEAIEYLKMLQVQLQMMSMRSGMGIPPLIPTGMQHLQMPQMSPMLPMGMGMGMQMAPIVGIGTMDVNSIAVGRNPSHLVPHSSHSGLPHSSLPLMPHLSHVPAYNVSQNMPTFPSHGGSSSHSVSATSPALSMVDPHNICLQNNSFLDSVYLSRQNPPMHTTPQDYHTHSFHHQQQQ